MSNTLVTLIVPVYNVEKYLEVCLISIAKQTYKNIEVIVINDGSTDNSLEICNKFLSDRRFSVINKKNEGLSKSRQMGIDKAKGKYFCTIDSDDYINERYVEKLYKNISENNSDIAKCSRYDFSEKQKREISLSRNVPDFKSIDPEDIEINFNKYASLYNMSDSWDKMYKLEFVRKTNVKFELDNAYNGTDLLFNHLLLLHNPRISVVREPLLFHRNNELSRVNRKDKKMQEGFMIIVGKIIKEANNLGYNNNYNHEISKLFYRLQFMASYDVFLENRNSKVLHTLFTNFLKKNNDFIKVNNKIIIDENVSEKKNITIMQTAIKEIYPEKLIRTHYIFYNLQRINRYIKSVKFKKQKV